MIPSWKCLSKFIARCFVFRVNAVGSFGILISVRNFGRIKSRPQQRTLHYHSLHHIKSHCRRLDLQTEDWTLYALNDSSMHYTRNLIATDHANNTLLLLCWNPGRHSAIHDHPCDGCWMKVLQGQIQECRYRPEGDNQRLVCTQDTTQTRNDILYIEDSIGFHKVGNPHPTETAYTLHLYSPLIQSCKIWLNETETCTSALQNYSAYGSKLD